MNRLIGMPAFIKKAREKGKGHKLWLEILIFVALYIVCNIGQVFIAAIFAAFKAVAMLKESGLMDKLSSGSLSYTEYIDELTGCLTQNTGFMLVTLFLTAVTTAIVILFCVVIEKRKPFTMGFIRKNILGEYSLGFAIGTVMFAASAGLALATGSATLSLSYTQGSVGLIIAFLLGYVIQGMSEEVLCRGYFMVSAARKNSLAAALIASSVIFALLHNGNNGVSPLALLNIALFGIVMALYMIRRGSIWGVCAIHSAWNFVQGNIFGASVSGMPQQPSVFGMTSGSNVLLNGGLFGPEGGLCVTAVLVITVIILTLAKNKDEGGKIRGQII